MVSFTENAQNIIKRKNNLKAIDCDNFVNRQKFLC